MMNRSHNLILMFATAMLVTAGTASGQASRTWVSVSGDDTNPCSSIAPCRTFVAALMKTAPDGEISAQGPGGYGSVTITQPVTLSGDGTLAGVSAIVANGITVNVGPKDRVVLRSLSLSGMDLAENGIAFVAGGTLTLDHVTITGFAKSAVAMNVGGNSKLVVKDSSMTNGDTGVYVTSSSGLAQATFDNVHLVALNNGLNVSTNGRATISHSIVSANVESGILASASNSLINVEGCQVSFNDGTGLSAAVAGARLRVSDSEIYNNGTGIGIAMGAFVESARNNRIAGNGTSAAPNAPPISIQ